MILSSNDILKEGDTIKTEAGDTFGVLKNRNYIGQPVHRLINALSGACGWYVVRNLDTDIIIARLEEIRVSLWLDD